MSRFIDSLNGVMIAYVMGFVNSALALVIAFGVSLSETQTGTITAVVNSMLVMVAHAAHVNAKRTKPVIPAGPVDETGGGPGA